MKRKLAALLTALILVLSFTAFAADSRVESVEYKGFGILKIDFTRDCDWYAASAIALTDMSGAEIPYTFIGGEEEECYLRADAPIEGTDVNLSLTLGETNQNLTFTAKAGVEYDFRGDNVNVKIEKEKCDFCRQPGHDEDYCPERIDASNLPTDPDSLARLFDIDRCDRCGGIGHDDDRCPGK